VRGVAAGGSWLSGEKNHVASGKHTKNYGKSLKKAQFLIGKSTISTVSNGDFPWDFMVV